ncbi:beta-1,6-N-acetylglucosaminyltransferase [Actinomycetospora lemnae]|uniref:Peptide O-xylosyltransferase n=1 Tax=Actinomycetospora lemnae TaxID=3019891 RepID=A0ABT5SVA0_9PSEU|nr:beta-1,6-N-acetylglucosaminyltransferase [Actinomycetospora sp. DW7H6]MDD7966792.1 beta-1,6-N-acetylglucosaminyltransferase [Actinomycetospora sp. DW7H6]
MHTRRLIEALDPFPVFLHCDIATSASAFEAMKRDLPERCRVLPRMNTGWARWENVAAELMGYRVALETTDATHVALLSGSDYPLASTDEIRSLLSRHLGRSITLTTPMPIAGWGRDGGLSRLRYRHRVWRKHMLRLPFPRRLPRDVVPSGGPQHKILARAHARQVVDVAARRPDLVAFWRDSWVADETFVPSVLNSPELVPSWADEHVAETLWAIGWDGRRRKSPPWLTTDHLDILGRARAGEIDDGVPKFFARKFSTDVDTHVLDLIDTVFRGTTVPTS